MAENFDVFDFELTEDDREQIRGLDGGKSIILDHHDLEKVEWLLGYIKGSMAAK
jgi:diketogulonate reductase-like aldo/keto reductase